LATTAEQIIVAAQVTRAANHVDQLAPMLLATRTTLAAAGITALVQALVADARYWRAANDDEPHQMIRRRQPRMSGGSKNDWSRSAQMKLRPTNGFFHYRPLSSTPHHAFAQQPHLSQVR
jgi:hypothetical protein